VRRSFLPHTTLDGVFDDPVRPQDQKKKKVVLSRRFGATVTEDIQKYVTGIRIHDDNLNRSRTLSIVVSAFVPWTGTWPGPSSSSTTGVAPWLRPVPFPVPVYRLPCTPIHPSRFILFLSELLRPSFLSSPSPPSLPLVGTLLRACT